MKHDYFPMKILLFLLALFCSLHASSQSSFDNINQNVDVAKNGEESSLWYYVVSSHSDFNEVELVSGTYLRIGTYNLFFKDNSGNRDSTFFLHTAELPNHSKYGFAGASKKISFKSLKNKIIDYGTLRKIIINSISISKKDNSTYPVRSHHLRTLRLRLVWKEDEEYYLTDNVISYSEIFLTSNFDNYHANVINFNEPKIDSANVIAILKKQQTISNVDSIRKYTDRWLYIGRNLQVYNAYQFKYTKGEAPYQGTADIPEYSFVNVLNEDLLYIPNVGIVGETFYNHFSSFYYWIPGVERVRGSILKVATINNLNPISYFEKFTNWKWY